MSANYRPSPSGASPSYADAPRAEGPTGEPPEEEGRSLGRGFLTAFLVTVILLLAFLAVAMVGYIYIAMSLPAPEELSSRSATFVSTKIYDRNNVLLYEIFDPQAGRRTLAPFDEISPYLVQATIATEDANFYFHPGVDPVGVLRAIVRNLRAGEVEAGGSTIPQQLVKLVFLNPERTLTRKIKEAVLAAEVTRRYSKDKILEIYLNEIFYGNLSYGVEAAAETYFGKPVNQLTLAEAALLAGIPQGPALYDPFTNPEGALERRSQVLRLMVKYGYITQIEADAANLEPLPVNAQPFDIRAPHFVMYVRQILEERYGPEVLYKAGLQVHTTLDYHLQEVAEQAVSQQVAALADRNVTNGALIALRPRTGEIVAMVGSRGFFDPNIEGQVNNTIRLHQPGSSIKPLTYLAAFEKGWTPATLVWDLPVEYPNGANPPYKPVNYDGKFHGPTLVRQALGNSYNVPAVKTLQFVGLPDFLALCQRMGISTLTGSDYGLALTLGGGDVTPLELTSAFGVLANSGTRVPPVAILSVEDSAGQAIERFETPTGTQVISPQHAYLITHILSDNDARQPMFGQDNPLRLSRPAAAKTGTTNDYQDNWTVGYAPSLVTGVWVGNNDNSPMVNVSGIDGAAPIWRQFMETVLAEMPAEDFTRPEGIDQIEICADSGTRPSEACLARKLELFKAGQGPLGAESDIHQLLAIDTSTGQLATEFCPAELVEKRSFEVYPPEALEWARANNRPLAPTEYCTVHGRPAEGQVGFLEPYAEQTVFGSVPIVAVVRLADLEQFVVEYGEGSDPLGWGAVAGPFSTEVDGGVVANWDTSGLKNMDYTLRIVARDRGGLSLEGRLHVYVDNGRMRATEQATPVFTETPVPSATPTAPTLTPTPTVPPAPPLAALNDPLDGAIVSGQVPVGGNASGSSFAGFRLEYGAGFDPAGWTTLVESHAPANGYLSTWDTAGLDGLYALRLVALGQGGVQAVSVVRVTVDNQTPRILAFAPQADASISSGQAVIFSVSAEDNLGLSRVEFYLDRQPASTVAVMPYQWSLATLQAGSHTWQAVVYDLAGNSATTGEIVLEVTP